LNVEIRQEFRSQEKGDVDREDVKHEINRPLAPNGLQGSAQGSTLGTLK